MNGRQSLLAWHAILDNSILSLAILTLGYTQSSLSFPLSSCVFFFSLSLLLCDEKKQTTRIYPYLVVANDINTHAHIGWASRRNIVNTAHTHTHLLKYLYTQFEVKFINIRVWTYLSWPLDCRNEFRAYNIWDRFVHPSVCLRDEAETDLYALTELKNEISVNTQILKRKNQINRFDIRGK